ncbi:MAG: CobD/CbiB family cobalamin biosynthesis protein [Desulfovibrio sp.]|uniref:CobD/CbiB family cobalamin biosynthesis protein n=1 Tax=Desulfovibrio sp. TaxID=885 RepID=UPI0039E3E652
MSLPHGLSLVFPWSVWECWWLAPLALVLDLWLGDPALPWRHPVCLVGKLLDWLERPARRFMLAAGTGRERGRGRLAGAAALLALIACTGFAVWAAVSLPLLGLLAAIYLAWAGLAMGSLLQTGQLVLERVEHAPETGAREALSWLVSRDTSVMDRPLMRKTLADTLSENLTDAFTAPFFWLLVGGPVALWCYKAVSTTDSMWGYMTEKWRWLGWAGARSDDVLAFVPARLAALSAGLVHVLFLVRQNFEAECRAGRHGSSGALFKRWPLARSLVRSLGHYLSQNRACRPKSDTAHDGACGTGHSTGCSAGQSQNCGPSLSATTLATAYLPGRWDGSWPGLAVVARQAAGMPSPNSGWPMTACAWLCGARMAGPSVYFGELVNKPWLGPPPQGGEHTASLAVWDAPRLLALCALLRQSALYGGLALWLLALVCLFIF